MLFLCCDDLFSSFINMLFSTHYQNVLLIQHHIFFCFSFGVIICNYFYFYFCLTRIIRWGIFIFSKASCTFLSPYFCLSFVWLFHHFFKSMFSSSTYVLLSNLFSLLHFIETQVCWGVMRIHLHFLLFFCYFFWNTILLQHSNVHLWCVVFFSHYKAWCFV